MPYPCLCSMDSLCIMRLFLCYSHAVVYYYCLGILTRLDRHIAFCQPRNLLRVACYCLLVVPACTSPFYLGLTEVETAPTSLLVAFGS